MKPRITTAYCEIAVKEILPSIRALLAKELSKKYTQKQIAEVLGTTQPAISRYLKQARGKKAKELLKKPNTKRVIKAAAEKIIKGKKVNYCELCKKIGSHDKCN